MRIGFTGAGGTGKTTTARILTQELGVSLPVPRSASRVVYEREGLTEDKCAALPLTESWALQTRIAQAKVEVDKAPEFLADRTLLDHWVYGLMYCNRVITNEEFKYAETVVRNHMANTYDLIVYFPWGLFTPSSDGVRQDRQAWQASIDAMIRGYLTKWRHEIGCKKIKILQTKGKMSRALTVHRLLGECSSRLTQGTNQCSSQKLKKKVKLERGL